MESHARRSCSVRRALPPRGFSLRLRHLAVLTALAAGCAGAPVKPSVGPEELKELRSQLDAQSALVAQQQRRIEELEVKLAALTARSQPAVAPAKGAQPAVAPGRVEPRPQMKTVKMGEG